MGARDYPVSPRLAVADPRAEVLGRYVSDGKVSAASCQLGRHRSVFFGDFGLEPNMLRVMFEAAGAHVWTRGGEVAYTDGRILMVHSGPGGMVRINLPAGQRLASLDPGRPLKQTGAVAQAAFNPAESRWFRIENCNSKKNQQ